MKNEIFGGLLEFDNEQKLIEFLSNIDLKVSIEVIEAALEYSNSRGTYTLQEAYCVFLCIKQMKKLFDRTETITGIEIK